MPNSCPASCGILWIRRPSSHRTKGKLWPGRTTQTAHPHTHSPTYMRAPAETRFAPIMPRSFIVGSTQPGTKPRSSPQMSIFVESIRIGSVRRPCEHHISSCKKCRQHSSRLVQHRPASAGADMAAEVRARRDNAAVSSAWQPASAMPPIVHDGGRNSHHAVCAARPAILNPPTP